MDPQFNFWLEIDGEVALSIWRVRLLQAVADTGSISGAAAQLDVPYRIAWQKINEMEKRLDQKLVETQIGGRSGGGAVLTAVALEYIQKFEQFSQEAVSFLHGRYREIFVDNPR
jgi:molybdate transport system regulatory protein